MSVVCFVPSAARPCGTEWPSGQDDGNVQDVTDGVPRCQRPHDGEAGRTDGRVELAAGEGSSPQRETSGGRERSAVL